MNVRGSTTGRARLSEVTRALTDVCPALRITDRGLVDGVEFEVVPAVAT